MTARGRALAIAAEIGANKGLDVVVFDLAEVSSFTNFFVIATGTSDRHVKTLAETAVRVARSQGDRPLGVEGDPPGRWILVDLGDIVVHLFEREAREFYALERLWGEAPRAEAPDAMTDKMAKAGP